MSGVLQRDADIFDLTIIGGGPTGLYAAYYAGLRGMRAKIVDSLEELGGQLTALYPEKDIYDVAGFYAVTAKDLARNLTKQMMQYSPAVVLGEEIVCLAFAGHDLDCAFESLALTTKAGTIHYSKAVLIAAGIGAFTPRKLEGRGVAEHEGKGIYYHVNDVYRLAGKRIVIVGGGDSAFDWSMNLCRTAKSILQIHRSDKFRAHEDTVAKVKTLPVRLLPFHELKQVHGAGAVEGVTIFDNRTMEEFYFECDAVLLNLGFISDIGRLKEWGLKIDGNHIVVSSRMETNRQGVYAAGDIVEYPGKLRLLATGFGEAAIAVNHAKAYIDPKAKANPGHSSEMGPAAKTQ